jgi:predicted O-methyltransferase YrrM
MDAALDRVVEIEGSTTAEVIEHLFELAQRVRDGCIVEIGSWRERSTAALALGSQRAYQIPVYAIEPHEQFLGIYRGNFGSDDRVKFFDNMLRLGVLDTVRLVNLCSPYVTHTWPMPVGLLWVDGDHRYQAVKSDILCWLPHLRPDATIVFDDATDSRTGPYHVVEELVRGGRWSRGPEIGNAKTLVRMSDEKLDAIIGSIES